MSQFTNLALLDGLATAVSRTFSAKALIDGRWTWWYEAAGLNTLAYPSITTKTVFAKDPNGVTRHEINVKIPATESAVAGVAPRIAYFHEAKLIVTTSGRGTIAERSDLLAYVKNLLASTRLTEIIVNLDPPR